MTSLNVYYQEQLGGKLTKLAEKLGIPREPAQRATSGLIAMRTEILELVAVSFFPEEEKHELLDSIVEQYRKFQGTAGL